MKNEHQKQFLQACNQAYKYAVSANFEGYVVFDKNEYTSMTAGEIALRELDMDQVVLAFTCEQSMFDAAKAANDYVTQIN